MHYNHKHIVLEQFAHTIIKWRNTTRPAPTQRRFRFRSQPCRLACLVEVLGAVAIQLEPAYLRRRREALRLLLVLQYASSAHRACARAYCFGNQRIAEEN